MGAVDRVRELVVPIIEQAGGELYDVEHESGIVRIAVDKEGGIDVDTLGDVSRLISDALDERDPIPDSKYLLEVTSPGIERKLRTPEHFAKQLGEDVNIKVRSTVEGDRRFTARLDAAGDEGIDVTVQSVGEPVTRHIAYDDIESARTIFHWGEQTTSPGGRASSPRPSERANAKTTNKKAATR